MHSNRSHVLLALLCAASSSACSRNTSEFRSGSTTTLRGGGSSGSGSGSTQAGGGGSFGSVVVLDDGGSDASGPLCTAAGACVHSCADGGTTTVRGKVFDPAGRNPLYDVAVYVPSTAVSPLPDGVSCDSCAALYTGGPIASAITDATGSFTMTGVPDGANIPIVVQIGKWRMQTTLPKVTACADNPQIDGTLRLPRNHTEGDIPQIAIATGGADTLECLLRRVGVDGAEFEPGSAGPGHVHIFQGDTYPGGNPAPNTAPPGPAPQTSLWDSVADLSAYSLVLLSCEGVETTGRVPRNLLDYVDVGGRVFASHLHYAWFSDPTSPFYALSLATWTTGTGDIGNIDAVVETTYGGQPFPKGQALHDWLSNVGALTAGELPIQQARHNADVAAVNVASVPWIVADNDASAPGATEYFSFDTPVGADAAAQCGRVVFSDLHVGAASGDYASGGACPDGCANNPLSPQEAALEFILFDLSACLTPVTEPPRSPPVR